MRRPAKIGVSALVVIAVAAFAGYWFLWRGEPVATAAMVDTVVTEQGPVDGTWHVYGGLASDDASSSWVSYRIDEHLLGATKTISGIARGVSGGLEVHGTTVSKVQVSADLGGLRTDNAARDESVRSYLAITQFPSASFTSTAPVELAHAPVAGELVTAKVTGELRLHGVARPVTAQLQARWSGTHIQVIGSVPVRLADHGIDVPELPGIVKADDHAVMEIQLFLRPSS